MKNYLLIAGILLIVSSLGNVISDLNKPKYPDIVIDTVYNGIKPLNYQWVDRENNHFTVYIDTIKNNK